MCKPWPPCDGKYISPLPPCKGIQDGLGFRIHCQWNLDSGLQSPGLQKISAKISWIPESGFPYLMVSDISLKTAGQKKKKNKIQQQAQTQTTESQLAAALNIQTVDLACITWSLALMA